VAPARVYVWVYLCVFEVGVFKPTAYYSLGSLLSLGDFSSRRVTVVPIELGRSLHCVCCGRSIRRQLPDADAQTLVVGHRRTTYIISLLIVSMSDCFVVAR
jgi:hypothetical protein